MLLTGQLKGLSIWQDQGMKLRQFDVKGMVCFNALIAGAGKVTSMPPGQNSRHVSTLR
jgi:hypothetical protein